jgi:hypothetical protein
MISLINKTLVTIILAAAIFSCSKQKVMLDTNSIGITDKPTTSNGSNDTPYATSAKLDTPYIETNVHKYGDTPYLGNKIIDTPYVKK